MECLWHLFHLFCQWWSIVHWINFAINGFCLFTCVSNNKAQGSTSISNKLALFSKNNMEDTIDFGKQTFCVAMLALVLYYLSRKKICVLSRRLWNLIGQASCYLLHTYGYLLSVLQNTDIVSFLNNNWPVRKQILLLLYVMLLSIICRPNWRNATLVAYWDKNLYN